MQFALVCHRCEGAERDDSENGDEVCFEGFHSNVLTFHLRVNEAANPIKPFYVGDPHTRMTETLHLHYKNLSRSKVKYIFSIRHELNFLATFSPQQAGWKGHRQTAEPAVQRLKYIFGNTLKRIRAATT